MLLDQPRYVIGEDRTCADTRTRHEWSSQEFLHSVLGSDHERGEASNIFFRLVFGIRCLFFTPQSSVSGTALSNLVLSTGTLTILTSVALC
jgi:hypothetical protein